MGKFKMLIAQYLGKAMMGVLKAGAIAFSPPLPATACSLYLQRR